MAEDDGVSPEPVVVLMRAMQAIAERHFSFEEEAEFWFDSSDNRPSAHCEPTCTDTTCKGHTVKVQVCNECGYEHDDGYPIFRRWPCPTYVAARDALDLVVNPALCMKPIEGDELDPCTRPADHKGACE